MLGAITPARRGKKCTPRHISTPRLSGRSHVAGKVVEKQVVEKLFQAIGRLGNQVNK